MNQKKLDKILKEHKLWLHDNTKGKKANLQYADLQYADLQHADLQHADLRNANLRNADLQHADLQHADLQHADLRDANLRYADLRYADLDFSVFPLWCGSFGIKDDGRLFKQLLGHLARFDKSTLPKDIQKFIDKIPKEYKNDLCKRHQLQEE